MYVELHLHIEGAIPLPALYELAQKYDGNVRSIEELSARFQYRDFAHFIDTWVWKNSFLREYDDFTFIAEAVAADLAAQDIIYVEAFYSPGDFARHGLELGRITEALRTGLDRVAGTRINLICDLIRDFGPEQARRTVDEVVEVRELGVLGVGLGGMEAEHPAELFRDAYDAARAASLHLTAHAGEAAGADSVWNAIDVLGVERVGHGVRAVEDPALVERLVADRIPLEVCPISNLCTGVVSETDEHPVVALDRAGVIVTINTDDPKMFNTSIQRELQWLIDRYDYSSDDVLRWMLQAVDACWLDTTGKQDLRERIHERARKTG